jgi:diguanylate cyclase (GGDEF)-like protein/PAS domain S-box-containing protein
MLSPKSALGRAILASILLVMLLASVATLAVLRNLDMRQRHQELENTSSAATALESAQARFWRAQATLSTLAFLNDPSFVDDYHATVALLEQDLSRARADALAAGEADHVAVLDDLTQRIDQFNEQVNLALPLLLEADLEARAQLAAATAPAMVSDAEAIIADLEALVEAHASDAAAATAAADRAADTTLWLLMGFSAAAFLVAAGTMAMLIVSVVGPLAALRASARAITAGDQEARARVSGPEEVASLARDFNEMTDALAAKTQEFIDTANLTGVSILRLDKDGRIAFLNDAACQFLGRPREELLGAQITDYLHPDDVAAATEAIREMARSKGSATGVVTRYITPTGTRIAEWNAYPVFDEEGRYAGLQGTGRDITERMRAEDRLRFLSSVAEQSSEGIAMSDLEGNLLFVNDAFAAMHGHDPDELVGEHLSIFHTPEQIPAVEAANRQIQERGEFIGEIWHVRHDGTVFPTLMHNSRLRNEAGTPIGMIATVRDITERKRVEEALRGAKEFSEGLIASMQEGFSVLDSRGVHVDVNPALCQMTGFSREELIGVGPPHPYWPPEAYEEIERAFQKTLRGRFGSFELTFMRKNGERFPVIVSPSWIRDSQGNVVSYFATFKDITERKRVEQALRESEERLKILFEFAPDAYYLNDLQGNFVDGNRAAEAMTGYKREELIGRNMAEVNLIPPEQTAKAAANVVGNARGLPSGPDEFTLIRKDGSQVPVEIRTFPVKIEDQTLVLSIARDITARKRAEQALRESESKYRTLVENLQQKVFFKDRNSVYVSCNEKYARDLNISPDEIAGKTDCDFYPKELADKYRADDKRIMESGETEDIEEEYLQDGRKAYVHTVKTPVRDENGSVVGVLGVFWDVTERRKAEQERARLHAELEVRTITDSLTGLYNHAYFYQRLAEEIDRSKRYRRGFAVVMMDVDDFKRYNDSRGHQAGDEMLRLVGDCIRTGLRSSDIAFRYGGDEFAAILPHANTAKARAAVERINGRITKSLKQMDGGSAVRLSLSAGVACFPDDGTAGDDLVRIADAALYKAKWVARARDIMGQREDIQSLISALVSRRSGVEAPAGGAIVLRPEALHEQQARIVSSVASSIAVALKDAGVSQALEDPDLQVLATVGAAAEIKDRYIRGHQERTSEVAAALAGEMGLSPERVRDIRIAGLLHDIGKVSVSESVLNKPGRLTKREFASIKDHPIVGTSLVSQVKGFERLAPIVRHHHERFDGKGYPDGFAGEQIPLEAHILSVADVFDAMTHERSYRKALSREQAIAELERGAGTQFDPAVVKAFLALVKRPGEKLVAATQTARKDRRLAGARAGGRTSG